MKESIQLRQRSTPAGNVSLYLDIYRNGKREYEYLKLYLIPEKSRADKEKNRETLKLAEAIKLEDFYIDSIAAGSYQCNVSTGVVQLRSTLKLDPKGRNILIVDEVLDSGRTLKAIRDNLLEMGALNVQTAVLVEKNIPRPEGVEHADWVGFFMDDRYLIGCGMDSEEKYRHYPGIAVLV